MNVHCTTQWMYDHKVLGNLVIEKFFRIFLDHFINMYLIYGLVSVVEVNYNWWNTSHTIANWHNHVILFFFFAQQIGRTTGRVVYDNNVAACAAFQSRYSVGKLKSVMSLRLLVECYNVIFPQFGPNTFKRKYDSDSLIILCFSPQTLLLLQDNSIVL